MQRLQRCLIQYGSASPRLIADEPVAMWAVEEFLPSWSLEPLVRSLQALRGVDLVVAMTFAAEVGDVTRFENPRQLMSYLGLVPS